MEKFDLGASGLVDPASAMRGLLNLDANLKSDGRREVDGTWKRRKALPGEWLLAQQHAYRIGLRNGLRPRETDRHALEGRLEAWEKCGEPGRRFDMGGAATKLNMKVDATNVAVGDIEGILPAIGVLLPSGANLQGGIANAHATISGPVDALITTGTVDVNNTKLTGYDLGSKLSTISKLAGIGSSKETLIQLFASNVRVSPEGTQAKQSEARRARDRDILAAMASSVQRTT